MGNVTTPAIPSRWELAAETIAVQIRWFGLIVGYVLINVAGRGDANQLLLNGILALGLIYALIDTYYSLRGRVCLARYPLTISAMAALFIGVICSFDRVMVSSF